MIIHFRHVILANCNLSLVLVFVRRMSILMIANLQVLHNCVLHTHHSVNTEDNRAAVNHGPRHKHVLRIRTDCIARLSGDQKKNLNIYTYIYVYI